MTGRMYDGGYFERLETFLVILLLQRPQGLEHCSSSRGDIIQAPVPRSPSLSRPAPCASSAVALNGLLVHGCGCGTVHAAMRKPGEGPVGRSAAMLGAGLEHRSPPDSPRAGGQGGCSQLRAFSTWLKAHTTSFFTTSPP